MTGDDRVERIFGFVIKIRWNEQNVAHALLLANKGDKTAAEHLRFAAKSTDPNVRELALRLLKELESAK